MPPPGAIARHVAGARTQAAHWRLIGIGSATLCACLATLVVLSPRSDTVVVHVVETPSFVAPDRRHHVHQPACVA
jgi:hypothetical protein